MKKLYVFDLDGTLLTGDFKLVDYHLRDLYREKADDFIHNMKGYLDKYEKSHPKYNEETLSSFLTEQTGLDFNPRVIEEWNYLVGEATNIEEEKAKELLEYLKHNDNKIRVLTNWFGDSQKRRLQREGLDEYIDEVIGGEIATKPHKAAYRMAAKGFYPDECVFIGNDVDNDYVGPRACGMDSILYDKNNIHSKHLVKVKTLDEVKERY